MPAEMKEVLSSHVWMIGYDPETAELRVRYAPSVKNPEGRVVIYHGVDPETAAAVEGAPSIGQALHQMIRRKFEAQ
jgi:predicted GH43/DUF377 family glycosyl hydrolase